MPMKPNAGESESDFMGRCVPEMLEGRDQDQAVAICLDIWRNKSAPEIVRKASVHPETAGAEFVMSDATVDRYGDVVEAAGWQLDNFKAHPIALWNHNPDEPVGLWREVRVEGGRLRGRLVFAEAGSSPTVDKLRKLHRQGVVRAVSVGFRRLAAEPIDPERPFRGTRFKRQELLECSIVSVPANPSALQVAKSLNLSADEVDLVFGPTADMAPTHVARGFPGPTAAHSPAQRTGPMDPLAKKIETARTRFQELKDQLTAHIDGAGEEPDDAAQVITEELTRKLEAAQRNLANLENAERQMGDRAVQQAQDRRVLNGEILPPVKAFAPVKKLEPRDHAMQVLVGMVVGQRTKKLPHEVIAERYGSDGKIDPVTRGMLDIVMRREGVNPMDVVQRAVTAPATTTTSGWASQLVQTTNMGFLDLLMPMSVFPGLRARAGLALDFGRSGVISIPNRVATPTVAGSFVAEGAAIPVRQAAFSSQTLTPKKMGVITAFTREIAEHSNPTIEALLRNAIQEDTSVSLDTVLLDATVATAIRPAGIRAGVSVTTATAGGGFAALVGDIKALLSALITGSSGNLRRPVWIMNPIQAIAIGLTQNAGGDFPFKQEVNAGTFQGWPIILSSTVTAGMVIVVDAADFAVVEGAAPRFDLSDQTVLVFDDTAPAQLGTTGSPNVVGAPARSMFQTDSIALRMIFDVNWALVRTGTVAWTQAVTW